MFSVLPFLVLALGALASPLEKRAVEVTIANGTILGGTDGNVEYFKGIPYAQPPIGDLRFRHPQPYDSNFGRLNATERPPACLQGTENESEDCLKLIVLRPASRPPKKLPVTVFIHGGAFSGGEAEQGNDGTPIVKAATDMGAPIVFVSIQYRLGAFGFLGGKEVAATGATNLGLRDQRLALQWVRDNIASFGGDPDKVTLWGFSAGAMSAFDHTIINDGNSGGLFRGVILGSGSVLGTESIDSVKAQEVYDTVVSRAGCSQSSASLECLRGLDADTLLEKASSLNKEFKWLGGNPPYGPRPDPADTFFPRNADAALVAGKFAKVPVLTGNSEDEGTLFAILMANITTNQILVDYMSTYYPGREQFAAGLVSKYPNDLGISGSPFRTGLQNNIFGQYKRLAAILGDITFIMQRRYHLSMIASHVPCWSYLSSSLHGLPTLGSFHGGDGMQTLSSSTGSPAVTQRRYVISFINTLDPNGLGISSPLIQFPKYTPADRRLVHMQKSSNTLLKDDFRAEQYQYFSENISKLRL